MKLNFKGNCLGWGYPVRCRDIFSKCIKWPVGL